MDVHDDGFDAEEFLRCQEPAAAAVHEVSSLVGSSQQLQLVFLVQVQVGPAQQGVDVFVEDIPGQDWNAIFRQHFMNIKGLQ